MWLGPIYLLAPYLFGFALLGLVTLLLLPGLRVTLGNVIVFAIGGLIGMLTISHYAYLFFLGFLRTRNIGLPPPYGTVAAVTIAITGAETVGVLAVWMKSRFRSCRR